MNLLKLSYFSVMTSRIWTQNLSWVLLSLFLVGPACQIKEPVAFVLSLPHVEQRVLSSSDFCDKISGELQLIKLNEEGARQEITTDALLKGAINASGECIFSLAESLSAKAGEYEMQIKLWADVFVAQDFCSQEQNTERLLLGGYFLPRFDFPDGFSSPSADDFISTNENAPDGFGNLNIDGDFASNLNEFLAESNPCKQEALPEITIEPETEGPYLEGEPIFLLLHSVQAEGVDHKVSLTIKHNNTVEEGSIVALRFYQSTANPTPVSGSFSMLPPRDLSIATDAGNEDAVIEGWLFEASVQGEAVAGNVTWRIRFIPDEPFIGALDVSAAAFALDGTELSQTAPLALNVENVPDAPILLVEDSASGEYSSVSTLVFSEEYAEPTVNEIRFRLQSIDLEADTSAWTLALGEAPLGMILEENLGIYSLFWRPNNQHVLERPEFGYEVTLVFTSPDETRNIQRIMRVQIQPLFNNRLLFGDFSTVNTALPPGVFTNKIMYFTVDDPDQVAVAPSCSAAVTASENSSCTAEEAFSSISCEVSEPLENSTWPFVINLVTSENYASCGETPSFWVNLSLSDTAPPTAEENEPIITVADCYNSDDDNCREPLLLQTGVLAERVLISGFEENLSETSSPLIDTIVGKALLQITEGGVKSMVLVDLKANSPAITHRYADLICEMSPAFSWAQIAGFVDETLGYAWFSARMPRESDPTSCRSSDRSLVKMNLNEPYDVFVIPKADLCPSSNNVATPVQGPDGSIWIPCGGSDELVRVLPDGNITRFLIADVDGNSTVKFSPLVLDETGKAWFVYLHNDGISLVDLSSLDADSPNVVLITKADLEPDNGFSISEISDVIVDQSRAQVLMTQSKNRFGAGGSGDDAAVLHRISFLSTGPQWDALDVGQVAAAGNNGSVFLRMVLRDGSERPLSAPDVVLVGSAQEERPFIDLDSFTLVQSRDSDDYTGLTKMFSIGLSDFFFSPRYDRNGFSLIPWDVNEQVVSQDVADFPSSISRIGYPDSVTTKGRYLILNEETQVQMLRLNGL